MLEEKQGHFWNLHQIPNKNFEYRFSIIGFVLLISVFFFGPKIVIIILFENISSSKNKTKIENRDSKFCAEFDVDSKTVLFFF